MDSCLAGEYTPYFEWLIERVGGEEWWEPYVYSLIRLFERRYYYENELDAVMVSRGKALRTEALVAGVEPISVPSDAYEVSILEALIGLAEAIDRVLMRNGDNGRTERWFNDIMEALHFKDEDGDIDIEIDRFLRGTNQIVRGKRYAPFSKTIWQQVNSFYMNQFNLENDY